MKICYRRTRFSDASPRCDFIDEESDATTARSSANITLRMLKLAGKKINEFSAVEFTGATPNGVRPFYVRGTKIFTFAGRDLFPPP